MKIKNQLALFNAMSRLLVVLLLWLLLPVLIESVLYKHIHKGLVEKKEKFIEHLDKQEINDFIIRKDSSETYASFSTLHNEFLQLSRLDQKIEKPQTQFITEARIIEQEQNDYRILQYRFEYENESYLLEIGSSLGEIKDLSFAIRLFFSVVLFVILAVTFLMDTVYIEYLLKPFYKIIDTKIRHVNEPEKFDHTPINSHSADFRELDEVLNQMMDRIGELFKKEKQFIANVSHELLTPIALLKNKLENLLQNQSLNESAIDKIVASLKTLDRLKKVIGNLLLISRIENLQYEVNETIDCHNLVTELLEDIEDRIEDRGIECKNELRYHFEFRGNATLLHILLYNLIVNAVKYNKENGSILIQDEQNASDYRLSISDTGIGMAPNQLTRIFDRFARFDQEKEGHGLGLAIVQSIAHFHHITLEVTSEPGHGSTFTLVFPLAEN